MEAKKLESHEERPRYLARSYLYNSAEDFRRIAERLLRDAEGASPEHAKLMREAASKLRQESSSFDAAADVTPIEDEQDLPFG